ncbi:transposase [Streptomyces sp. NBC_00503]|nr:transposase [Streptomyces sp. NBC_00503]
MAGEAVAHHDAETYRRRNTVERCFNQLKGFRGVATRYEKTATSYEAAVTLTPLPIWTRSIRRGTLPLSPFGQKNSGLESVFVNQFYSDVFPF